jgi:hypothetical protein
MPRSRCTNAWQMPRRWLQSSSLAFQLGKHCQYPLRAT